MIERAVDSNLLWATPTVIISHENAQELNKGLARIILEKEKQILSKGKARKVAGNEDGITAHWLEYNVLTWEYAEIVEFRRMALDGLQEFFKLIGNPDDDPGLKIKGISCWANVLRYSESLDVHHHDPAFVSAHYTVQSGRDTDNRNLESQKKSSGGETVYFRPGFMERSHGGEAASFASPWDSDWRISTSPTEGKLFLFPSYVRHEVRPNLGQHERISIAMDVFVEKQNALIHFAPPRWYTP